MRQLKYFVPSFKDKREEKKQRKGHQKMFAHSTEIGKTTTLIASCPVCWMCCCLYSPAGDTLYIKYNFRALSLTGAPQKRPSFRDRKFLHFLDPLQCTWTFSLL